MSGLTTKEFSELEYNSTIIKYWLAITRHLDGMAWASLDVMANDLGLSLVGSSRIQNSELFTLMRVPILLTKSSASIITAIHLGNEEKTDLVTSIEFGELQESVSELCSLLIETSKNSGFT